MTTAAARRPSVAVRRAGYVAAAVASALMWYLVNVWPGWPAVPFLTDETRQVLPLVNTAIIAGLIANLIYLVKDPPWLRALGDLATTAIGLASLIRIWQVYPFSFGTSSFDWDVLVRVVLVVGIIGSVIGLVVQVVSLVRHIATR